jgi:hypothetical protein
VCMASAGFLDPTSRCVCPKHFCSRDGRTCVPGELTALSSTIDPDPLLVYNC